MTPTTQRDDEWSKTIEAFMDGFYGYGNPLGDYWLVGKEEGGGSSVEQIRKRLRAWQDADQPAFVDVAEYHRDIGLPEFFCWGAGKDGMPKLQPTWHRLIRVLLTATTGNAPTEQEIYRYQVEKLGRSEGETCLAELFPTARPHAGIRHVIDVGPRYRSRLAPRRISYIQQSIREAAPKLVIFYSTAADFRRYWARIVGDDFQYGAVKGTWLLHSGPTWFAIIPHTSMMRGSGAAYQVRVGEMLAQCL